MYGQIPKAQSKDRRQEDIAVTSEKQDPGMLMMMIKCVMEEWVKFRGKEKREKKRCASLRVRANVHH